MIRPVRAEKGPFLLLAGFFLGGGCFPGWNLGAGARRGCGNGGGVLRGDKAAEISFRLGLVWFGLVWLFAVVVGLFLAGGGGGD